MPRVLIIEDDKLFAGVLKRWLEGERYSIDLVDDGTEGLNRLRFYDYDALLVDWELPGVTGVEIVRNYRASGGSKPVLMMTGRRTIDDKEQGFNSGTDDYITKPFELRELSLRLNALLRRGATIQMGLLKFGDITLDAAACQVTVKGSKIEVRPKELALLEFFMRNPNRVFSLEALIERVWNGDESATPAAVRTSLKRLRQAIEQNGDAQATINNVHGLGYRLETKSGESNTNES